LIFFLILIFILILLSWWFIVAIAWCFNGRLWEGAKEKRWCSLAPPLLLGLVNTTSRSRFDGVDGVPATLLGRTTPWQYLKYRTRPSANLNSEPFCALFAACACRTGSSLTKITVRSWTDLFLHDSSSAGNSRLRCRC